MSTTAKTYYLTRVLLIRACSLVYLAAFLGAYFQNDALLGSKGLTPVQVYMARVRNHFGTVDSSEALRSSWLTQTLDLSVPSSLLALLPKRLPTWEAFKATPTFLWLLPEAQWDPAMQWAALSGAILAGAMLVTGTANAFACAFLWAAYHSIVATGQNWYSFGWESQLLETGFLLIFAVPVFRWRPYPRHDLPLIVRWLHRWLLFRIMLGAGLIKLRGDACWRDFTCMEYHYQTQPVPNPLSWLFHATPKGFHRIEVLANHFVEVAAPFFLLVPFPETARIGGAIQVLFQLVLISSGNLSFLNWLTMVPAMVCFDDDILRRVRWLFPSGEPSIADITSYKSRRWKSLSFLARCFFQVLLAATVAWFSGPVVENLLSQNQAMNTSFDWLKLVNTYGAFGSVTKERHEVIVEGFDTKTQAWRQYEFFCKPTNVTRRPCLISPYHYRLDWLMWFVGFQGYQHNPWLLHLAYRMLQNDEPLLTQLIAHNPFEGTGRKPSKIRMWFQPYVFALPDARGTSGNAGQRAKKGGSQQWDFSLLWQVTKSLVLTGKPSADGWWKHAPGLPRRELLPAVTITDLQDHVKRMTSA